VDGGSRAEGADATFRVRAAGRARCRGTDPGPALPGSPCLHPDSSLAAAGGSAGRHRGGPRGGGVDVAPAPPGRGGGWRWSLKGKRAGGAAGGAKGRRLGAAGAGWRWSRGAAAAARAGPPGRGRRKPLGRSLRYLPGGAQGEGPLGTHRPGRGTRCPPAVPPAPGPPWLCSLGAPRGAAPHGIPVAPLPPKEGTPWHHSPRGPPLFISPQVGP